MLFQRDCGATTGFSTQISVLAPGWEPKAGNVFVADDNHGKVLIGSWGPWVKVRWRGANHLLIDYASGARVFKAEKKIGSVRIDYVPIEPPPSEPASAIDPNS